MAASGFFALGAVVSGALAGGFAARQGCRWFRRRALSGLAIWGSKAPSSFHRVALWLARNGSAPLRRIAGLLLRVPVVATVSEQGVLQLRGRHVDTSGEALLSAVLLAGLAGVGVCWLITGSLICGIAVVAAVVAAGATWLGNSGDRRRARMREDLPEALRCMAAGFQSGLPLARCMEQVSEEVGGPLGDSFLRSANAVHAGCSVSEALQCLNEEASLPELEFVSVAMDVQHQTGGSMTQTLGFALALVEDRVSLARQMEVQTAQARLSARIVSAMPFVLVAVFSLVSKDFLGPFFRSAAGVVLLLVACLLEVGGILLVRRILRTDA